MDHQNKTTKSFFHDPNGRHKTGSGYSEHFGAHEEATMSKRGSNFFVSDQDIERIKDRIRKKHKTDTNRLLTLYGVLLVLFIWILGAYGVF